MSADTFWPLAGLAAALAGLVRGFVEARGIVRVEARGEVIATWLSGALAGWALAFLVWTVLEWTLRAVAPYGA